MPVPYDDNDLGYGATVREVKALLPHRRWTVGSKPDENDVSEFIASVAASLNVTVDPAPADPGIADRLRRLARRAVVLGAAAHAEAAGNPERARPNETSSYAEWLLERYQEAVDKAEAFAAEVEAGDIPGGGDVDADPAWAFPDPANFAARGI